MLLFDDFRPGWVFSGDQVVIVCKFDVLEREEGVVIELTAILFDVLVPVFVCVLLLFNAHLVGLM